MDDYADESGEENYIKRTEKEEEKDYERLYKTRKNLHKAFLLKNDE